MILHNGIARTQELRPFCYPQGEMTLQFSATWEPMLGITGKPDPSYTVSNRTTLFFRHCRQGEYIKDNQCLVCSNGTYNLDPYGNGTCRSCVGKEGIVSCGGKDLELKAGYWRRYPRSHKVLPCILGELSCPTGFQTGDKVCAEGYAGPLCATCAVGFFMSSSDEGCLPCESTSISPVQILAITILLFLVLLAFCGYNQYVQVLIGSAIFLTKLKTYFDFAKSKLEKAVGRLKIIVATYQVILSTAQVFDVKLPANFDRFTRYFLFLNLNITSFVPLTCIGESMNFIQKLLVATLGPIALAICLGLAFGVEYLRLKIRSNRYAESLLELYHSFESRYLNYFFYLTYLVLPSVSTLIFQLFVCKNVDPDDEDTDTYDSFLVADVRISCTSDYYKSWLWFGYLMILVYPVGIIVFYWICLYQFKDLMLYRDYLDVDLEGKKKDSEFNKGSETMDFPVPEPVDNVKSVRTSPQHLPVVPSKISALAKNITVVGRVQSLAFLWGTYKPEFWYWELIESCRRILLTAILSICSAGSAEQYVLGILLVFGFIKLYGYYRPYKDETNFIMADIGQSQIFLTYFAALAIAKNLLRSKLLDALGGLLIVVNLSVLFSGFYFEIRSNMDKLLEELYKNDDEGEEEGEDEEDEEDDGGPGISRTGKEIIHLVRLIFKIIRTIVKVVTNLIKRYRKYQRGRQKAGEGEATGEEDHAKGLDGLPIHTDADGEIVENSECDDKEGDIHLMEVKQKRMINLV